MQPKGKNKQNKRDRQPKSAVKLQSRALNIWIVKHINHIWNKSDKYME